MTTSDSQGHDTSAGTRPHPMWIFLQWVFFSFFVAGLIVGVIAAARQGLHNGVNVLALVSFAVTSFAVYVAIRIFREQTTQGDADQVAQKKILDKIDATASQAAENSYFTKLWTEKILRFLNIAQESKTGEHLTAEREAQTLRAYRAVPPWSAHQVLFIDDNKPWIEDERNALEAAGVATLWVPNTSRALDLLKDNSFDVVITDMKRAEGDREGYVFLNAMKERGDQTPVLVYSSSNLPKHVKEATDHGAKGATNDPSHLFILVMEQLAQSPGNTPV